MGSHQSAVSCARLDDCLKRASQSYQGKGSCTQAVLDAFMDEPALLPPQQPSNLCGVLRAAEAILRAASTASDEALGQIIERFRAEYGGVTCEDVLKNADASDKCCCMKVKDVVLLVRHALEQMKGEVS
ncbi:MAG: hypothetical protein PHI98_05190 [Eubacteriales bacterium]|nr:hypothetical protein [Eubacteriales bacterium]